MRFNLSEWALRHRSLIVYAMLVMAIAGAFSYLRLGRSEDPAFTFKVMVDPHAVAGRHRRGGLAPGHRAHRKEADGNRPVRVHPLVLARWRVAGDVRGQGLAALQGHPAAVVPGAQEGRRHPADAARRCCRSVLQ
jgi:hypothetical protein